MELSFYDSQLKGKGVYLIQRHLRRQGRPVALYNRRKWQLIGTDSSTAAQLAAPIVRARTATAANKNRRCCTEREQKFQSFYYLQQDLYACRNVYLLIIIGFQQTSKSAVVDHPYIITLHDEITDIHHSRYSTQLSHRLVLHITDVQTNAVYQHSFRHSSYCFKICRLLLPARPH